MRRLPSSLSFVFLFSLKMSCCSCVARFIFFFSCDGPSVASVRRRAFFFIYFIRRLNCHARVVFDSPSHRVRRE
ncbi:hypothetical protein RND81_05G205200 [Saponaria officinalis]|uniref:Secreted protein n=1 Tax=Saponaria officinalis TaxID=3572 RepID=A0AAW1KUF7_SAPOF